MMKKREDASDELIDKIISECAPIAEAMCPFLMQDPLLEPRLQEILLKIKKTNWRTQTTIYTTMHNADMETLKRIVDDGTLDNIMVSLYGTKWQRGMDEARAEKNVKELTAYRNSYCKRKPTITMQWINDLPGYEMHRARWEGETNGIQIVPFDTFHGTMNDRKDRTKGPQTKRSPCARLWNSFNIHSNGIVVPCCIDYEELMPMGNMKEQTALEIWNSDKFNELREMHMQGKWDEIPLCKDCIVWEWM